MGRAVAAYRSKNWPTNLCHLWFWESEEKMADARPKMTALLDSARHLLEELSPELGVTNPVSGTAVFEKQIN